MTDKEPVELLIDDDRRLYVRKKDGTEYLVNIFEGGGYYTALWLQTDKEMADMAKRREEAEKKWAEEIKAKEEKRKVNSLAKLIMFMQRRKP